MAGIYIHIPFCSQKCNYCDFYSIVNQNRKSEFLTALEKEIIQRKDYLGNEIIDTIYLGGGTPSILLEKELESIIKIISSNYRLSENLEFTLEANPEDLSKSYLLEIKNLGINRLSIGTQSFIERDLKFLKRNHSSEKAIKAVLDAEAIGIANVSIDLIYGIPNLSVSDWEANLIKAFELPIKHLSSYHLTYEEGTLLNKKLKKGLFKPLLEKDSLIQFELLMDYSKMNNMPFYEISNFASEGNYSKHNKSYWEQTKYLGLGPSAHSFNTITREWNVSNLNQYITGILNKNRSFELENLSKKDIQNEYLITRLRTKWGVDLNDYTQKFGESACLELVKKSQIFIVEEAISKDKNVIRLTEKGLLVSDYILEKLFIL